jgi:hypothetical protein
MVYIDKLWWFQILSQYPDRILRAVKIFLPSLKMVYIDKLWWFQILSQYPDMILRAVKIFLPSLKTVYIDKFWRFQILSQYTDTILRAVKIFLPCLKTGCVFFAHLFWPCTVVQETMQPGFQCSKRFRFKIKNILLSLLKMPLFSVNIFHCRRNNGTQEPNPLSSPAGDLVLTTGILPGIE